MTLEKAGCRFCVSEGNPVQRPIEDLHAVGHLFVCERHYQEKVRLSA